MSVGWSVVELDFLGMELFSSVDLRRRAKKT